MEDSRPSCAPRARQDITAHRLAARHYKSGTPPWSTPTHRRIDRLGGEAAACDKPGSRRIGVPHLPRAELVPTPHGRRNVRSQVEDPSGYIWIIRQSLRTFDRFIGIRDDSATPATHLVAEDPEASRPAASDGTLGDDAALSAVVVADGRLLDHEASLRHLHDERGVVEIARRPSLKPRCDRLEDASVQPHRMAARAEREPVEVDSSSRLCRHAGILTTARPARIGAKTDRACG
jgi:hypothetical protein